MTRPGPAQGATGAGEFLVSFGQRAVTELNDSALSEDERSRRFRSLFAEALDIPRIGRFILGRHWRRATPREREDFLAVFEDIALQRFLPMFTGKSNRREGRSFDIIGVRPVKDIQDQVFVYARVARKEGPPVDLTWRIREDGEKFKILDISVQGLSMALTLREEYGSGIRRWGGVGPLVKALRQKVRDGLFAPPAAAAGQ